MFTTHTNWTELRKEFPALERFTYLDTASFGQVPRAASAAMIAHLAHRDSTASARFLSWFDDMDEIRESCAQWIRASASDIAFVPSASTALSYLMQGLAWKAGEEVVTLEGEFPNQLYQSAALEKAGVSLRCVPWSELYASVTEKTRLVLVSTVNYATGFRPPLEEMSRFLRERNIWLYVDGTQSLGALAFDVGKLKPSMLAVDAYKWMISPNGAGFVYVSPELRERLTPTVVGWRSDAGWRRVGSLNHGRPIFAESAEKFEGGMLPFPSLYGMGAVLKLLHEIGPAEIELRVLALAGKTRQVLSALGAEVNTDESQIVTARLKDREAAEVCQRLKERQILVSARHGRLRVSPHFYNNDADLEALREAVAL